MRGLGGLRGRGATAAEALRDRREGNPEMQRTEPSFRELAAVWSGARWTDPREDGGGSLRAKEAMVKEAIACFLLASVYPAMRSLEDDGVAVNMWITESVCEVVNI